MVFLFSSYCKQDNPLYPWNLTMICIALQHSNAVMVKFHIFEKCFQMIFSLVVWLSKSKTGSGLYSYVLLNAENGFMQKNVDVSHPFVLDYKKVEGSCCEGCESKQDKVICSYNAYLYAKNGTSNCRKER